MSILLDLQKQLFSLTKGKDLILNQKDLLTLMNKKDCPASRMILARAVKSGIVQNPVRGLYVFSPGNRIHPLSIYKIAQKLRSGHFNYLSLESVLSQSGMISQMPIDRITVMTTGRSGVFELAGIGVVEFTHTKKTMDTLAPNLVWDSDIGMFRASAEFAHREMKRVGRNLDLIERYGAYDET
jgi:hypothetical protein